MPSALTTFRFETLGAILDAYVLSCREFPFGCQRYGNTAFRHTAHATGFDVYDHFLN